MAYDVSEVITLGIGTPAEITPFILLGLDANPGGAITIGYEADMNTRLLVYLRAYYTVSAGDLTTLVRKWMNEQTTGDANQRLQKLITDATNAMT